ncbi:OsmC family protein [Psychroserpens sp. Hel_I_66]|uniref:OsmC family protein n=1 Tax=Psychroserpens sp. Hel_I_66 TaxID=1250004 RepID=UPI000647DDD2|nr:OsmC family protein [Psychroserpens sp. Hel_I_66]
MSHKVVTHWKGNLQFESDNPSGHLLTMDTSQEHGGHNSGLRPKAMMLSSLAGCSGLDVVSILKKMKVPFSDFRIDTYGELTDEHPKYYHTVSVEYHFYGNELDQKKIEKAVHMSIDTYCGVMEMFRRFSEVKTSIHYHN